MNKYIFTNIIRRNIQCSASGWCTPQSRLRHNVFPLHRCIFFAFQNRVGSAASFAATCLLYIRLALWHWDRFSLSGRHAAAAKEGNGTGGGKTGMSLSMQARANVSVNIAQSNNRVINILDILQTIEKFSCDA